MTGDVFVLGESYGYYFEHSLYRYHARIPQGFHALLSNGQPKIVHCATFGKNSSYFASYRTSNGQIRIRTSPNLPPRLENWLTEKDNNGIGIRRTKDLWVTIGHNNEAWYATDGRFSIKENLPAALNLHLNEMQPEYEQRGHCLPRIVALGFQGDYILITDTGAASWRLKNYPGLRELLFQLKEKRMHFDDIEKITLDANRKHGSIIQYTNGAISSFGMPDEIEQALHHIELARIEVVGKFDTSTDGIEYHQASIQFVKQEHQEITMNIAQQKQIKREQRQKMKKYATRALLITAGIGVAAAGLGQIPMDFDFSDVFGDSSGDTTASATDVSSTSTEIPQTGNSYDYSNADGFAGSATAMPDVASSPVPQSPALQPTSPSATMPSPPASATGGDGGAASVLQNQMKFQMATMAMQPSLAMSSAPAFM